MRTTVTFGMCLTELSSTLSGKWFCDVLAPAPRGRTLRPCSIPGMRTFWM